MKKNVSKRTRKIKKKLKKDYKDWEYIKTLINIVER